MTKSIVIASLGDFMKFILSNFGDSVSFKSHQVNGFLKNGPHMHQFLEIWCVAEGFANITLDGVKKTVKAGEIAILHPFRLHFIQTSEDCKIWNATFSDRIIDDVSANKSRYIWGEDFIFRASDTLIDYIFQHLPPESHEHTSIEPDSPIMLNLKAIYYAIMQEYMTKIPQTTVAHYNTALASIYKFIEENYREDISIADVSKALGYSEKYISLTVSQVPNSNFRKIINQRRVNYAKWALLNSNHKVIDIALECGFQQERTFYRTFKEITGHTPFNYRKIYKFPTTAQPDKKKAKSK